MSQNKKIKFNSNNISGTVCNIHYNPAKEKMSEKQINKILEERAVKLAEEIDEQENSNYINIVEFCLNDEIYAIEAKYISQACNIERFTEIPCTPQFVLGITEIQEKIISIIDLRNFFDMQPPSIDPTSEKLIILENTNTSFAIVADRVIGMKQIFLENIQKNMAAFDNIRKKYFYGLTDEQTIILDGNKLLNDSDIVVQ